MGVFNPRIVDASIRDVTSCLSDGQKVEVLLYALQHLPAESSRTVIENAVQSCLQIRNLPSGCIAKARILRAKARLAAGSLSSAQQDLRATLVIEPENQEVGSLIKAQNLTSEMLREPGDTPKFSTEIWREIALCLPRRDLKSLLWVPHALSRIASQLLFREIDLYLTSSSDFAREDSYLRVCLSHAGSSDKDLDNWHCQRSADILTRILVDPSFASLVKTLRIFAATRDGAHPLTFETGMLTNALPKMMNLRNFKCSGSRLILNKILEILHSSSSRLRMLSLTATDVAGDIDIPKFRHITHFSYTTEGGNCVAAHEFLSQSRDTLRAFAISNLHWRFPTEAISVRNLTQIDFHGVFPADTHPFSEILSSGHQLESLSLSGLFECAPSSSFRLFRSSLPFLRHFAINISGLHRHVTDRDLIPAISEFLRDRTQLQTFELVVPRSDLLYRRIGFDASAWGVLPSLTGLRSLFITYPKDLSPALAAWLIPRSVRALTLDFISSFVEDPVPFLNHLRPGVPPLLKYVAMTDFPLPTVFSVVEHGFPNVRVVRVGGNFWTMEAWPARRAQFHATEWLESLDCEDAVWHGVSSKI
ncbi:hypothetical protein SERLADRAFT_452993 [Serpula lacrymans var. lacrymans S7.9]|uniref:Uncharacterized protein n=1 Tax=Serpula lacrymans var. lacrymans (strain S7.9) TaxID=578457 RepID=F8P9I6_SERL9|nr:uncharacterized protein SERLADRAFT_452993 [Serpula lacrymans var. lacrymans S7.9]EGO20315.1 hypothetical protein SERLADRAFT_452993 [Serpula lacrymans var. lacrymans S7.9]